MIFTDIRSHVMLQTNVDLKRKKNKTINIIQMLYHVHHYIPLRINRGCPLKRKILHLLQSAFLKTCLATTPWTLISCREENDQWGGGEGGGEEKEGGEGMGVRSVKGSLAHQGSVKWVMHKPGSVSKIQSRPPLPAPLPILWPRNPSPTPSPSTYHSPPPLPRY